MLGFIRKCFDDFCERELFGIADYNIVDYLLITENYILLYKFIVTSMERMFPMFAFFSTDI